MGIYKTEFEEKREMKKIIPAQTYITICGIIPYMGTLDGSREEQDEI